MKVLSEEKQIFGTYKAFWIGGLLLSLFVGSFLQNWERLQIEKAHPEPSSEVPLDNRAPFIVNSSGISFLSVLTRDPSNSFSRYSYPLLIAEQRLEVELKFLTVKILAISCKVVALDFLYRILFPFHTFL